MTLASLFRRPVSGRAASSWLPTLLLALAPALSAQTLPADGRGEQAAPAAASGPIRLRQAPPAQPAISDSVSAAPIPRLPPAPSEFERFVRRLSGDPQLIRLGAAVMASAGPSNAEVQVLVPGDYLVGPGDEIQLTIWGSVDADLRLQVDRTGRITIPRVGPVTVAGVRHEELAETISRRVAGVFRNFQLSASIGQLRGIRIFVTGYAAQPGAYTVSSLSTVMSALIAAGGPSTAGSFRRIELRRGAQAALPIDLYDLLLKGERVADRVLQAGDVVHIGAVGPQVAVIGSVNLPSVIELRGGETVADAIRFAGGPSAVADRSRAAIERLTDRVSVRVSELKLPAQADATLADGDVVQIFSAVDFALPTQRQTKRVRIEGEVARPGSYLLAPTATIGDALRQAGGLTDAAFLFGTEFSRESVRQLQQENYERALRDLETELVRANTTTRTATTEDAAVQQARNIASNRLVEQMRAIRPSGRVVLQLAPDATALPELVLEDGDRLFVPPRPTTVGVFGSVFNSGSYLYADGRKVDDYLRLAGGPTRGADEDSIFLIRANGSVISARQQLERGWFSRKHAIGEFGAEPGDTIFVPEENDKTTFVQGLKDWTQIIYQFGIGLAGLKAATR
jgi:protein involved in polysaccharide export with SLBB domain